MGASGYMDSWIKLDTEEQACLELCAGGAGHLVGDLAQVDPANQVHLARVNAQDVSAGGLVGVGELNLAVDAARPQQRRVQDVDSVGRHQHLFAQCGAGQPSLQAIHSHSRTNT